MAWICFLIVSSQWHGATPFSILLSYCYCDHLWSWNLNGSTWRVCNWKHFSLFYWVRCIGSEAPWQWKETVRRHSCHNCQAVIFIECWTPLPLYSCNSREWVCACQRCLYGCSLLTHLHNFLGARKFNGEHQPRSCHVVPLTTELRKCGYDESYG